MASLVPSTPSSVLTIRQISPNIHTLSLPFLRFGKIPIGGRCTIARLSDSTLAVISPTALTPEVHSLLTTLAAPVAYLVAPDIEHHLYLSDWSTAFPSAKLIGVHGLPEKRAAAAATAAMKPPSGPAVTDIPFTTVFTPNNHSTLSVSPAFDETFSTAYLPGHVNHELALLHKADRTLIQADILFNLPATEQYSRCQDVLTKNSGLLYKIFSSMNHTDASRGWTLPRFWQWYVVAKDRESYGEGIRKISAWDFDTVVPCHGDVLQGDGKERFLNVMKWFLEDNKKSA